MLQINIEITNNVDAYLETNCFSTFSFSTPCIGESTRRNLLRQSCGPWYSSPLNDAVRSSDSASVLVDRSSFLSTETSTSAFSSACIMTAAANHNQHHLLFQRLSLLMQWLPADLLQFKVAKLEKGCNRSIRQQRNVLSLKLTQR